VSLAVLKSSAKPRRAGRVVRYTRKDGTQVEKRYPAFKPKAAVIAASGYSVGELVAGWQKSPRWRNLRPGSQAGYTRSIRHLLAASAVDARTLTRRDMLTIRDAVADERGIGAAREFVTAAGAMFAWALDYGWDVQPNICARLRRDLPKGEWPAWSGEEVALALQHLPERLCRAIILAMYTGQRRGDLVKMTWADLNGDAMRVAQEKTQVKLAIPVLPVLKAHLEAWRATTTVVDISGKAVGPILRADSGKPWKGGNLSAQLSLHLAKIDGFPPGRNVHGLRKLAAAMLAQAGCTAHEIMAITGHKTLAMVAHYTKSVDQWQAAQAAMAKLAAANG
jgi:integrase